MPRCRHCKKFSKAENMIKVPLGHFCDFECARKHGEAKREERRVKDAKSREKAARKALREFKQNDRSHQYDLTKRKIQEWVNKVRDAGMPCICCGALTSAQYCGGHYRTAGGCRELALDARNIHRQRNRTCNCGKSGNIGGDHESYGFREGLRMRYGQEFLDWLEGPHELPRYTPEQLREIRAYYSRLIREENPDDAECPYRVDRHIDIMRIRRGQTFNPDAGSHIRQYIAAGRPKTDSVGAEAPLV